MTSPVAKGLSTSSTVRDGVRLSRGKDSLELICRNSELPGHLIVKSYSLSSNDPRLSKEVSFQMKNANEAEVFYLDPRGNVEVGGVTGRLVNVNNASSKAD